MCVRQKKKNQSRTLSEREIRWGRVEKSGGGVEHTGLRAGKKEDTPHCGDDGCPEWRLSVWDIDSVSPSAGPSSLCPFCVLAQLMPMFLLS